MASFSVNNYKLLDDLGIHRCISKKPTYVSETMPLFIQAFLLQHEWPEGGYVIKKTKGFWFTGEDNELATPCEFLGNNTQKCEEYYILASDQHLNICLNTDEKNTEDPTIIPNRPRRALESK